MKKIVLALGGLSLAAAPVLAQGLPASALVEGESEIGGEGGAGIFAAAMIAGIAAMAVLAFSDGDDDDFPTSP